MQLSSSISEQIFPQLSQLLSYSDAPASQIGFPIGAHPGEPVLSRLAPAIGRPGTSSIRIALQIADGSGEELSIHVSGEIAHTLIEGAREIARHESLELAMPARQCRALGELIARCSDLEVTGPADGNDAATAVRGEASEDKCQRAPLPKWRMKRVVEFIDGNLEDGISLADLAHAAGLSPMHFARQFRRATNMRPREYLLRRRITRSQELLQTTEASLVDIALSVGFQGQAHFTTVFKRFTNTTPHQWRQEHCAAIAKSRSSKRPFC